MKPGNLYVDKKGNILLYERLTEDEWPGERTHMLKVIVNITLGSSPGTTLLMPSGYAGYLELLPKTHPAWVLYGNR